MEYDRDPSGWWLKVIGERVSAIKKRFRVIFYSISWFLLALTPGDRRLIMGPLRASLSKYVLCVHAGLWEQWTHKSHKMKMNRSTKFHVFIEASAPFRLSSGHTNYFISAVAYSYFRRLRRPRDKIMDALWPGNENDSAIWCWLSYFLPSAREFVHFISFHFISEFCCALCFVVFWFD